MHTVSDTSPGRVAIQFPANPAYVRVARLTAASLASRAGFGLDRVEDIRVAFDEVAVLLGVSPNDVQGGTGLDVDPGAGLLDVEFFCATGTLEIVASADVPSGDLDVLAQQVLEALSDQHGIADAAGRRIVSAAFSETAAAQDASPAGS